MYMLFVLLNCFYNNYQLINKKENYIFHMDKIISQILKLFKQITMKQTQKCITSMK